jgi:hypothetical protein
MVQGKNLIQGLLVLTPCNTWEKLWEMNGVLLGRDKQVLPYITWKKIDLEAIPHKYALIVVVYTTFKTSPISG